MKPNPLLENSASSLAARALRIVAISLIATCSAAFLVHIPGNTTAAPRAATSAAAPGADPWTTAQTVTPAGLVKELADTNGSNRPVVVCAGARVLYEGAHIPGAVFHGPASAAEGLDDLKKWAATIPRSSNVVVYCGCCPFRHCPNIRPAFTALQSLGFPHLRVLLLPHNFVTDWVNPGYPIAKGR